MAVLHDGIGKQDGERDYTAGEQGHKDQMRTRLRNQADHNRKQNHQRGVVADPRGEVDEIEQDSDDQEHPESPGEYARKMLADNMLPKMLLDEVVGGEKQRPQHYKT